MYDEYLDRISTISEHYSKKSQREKAIEEVDELMEELDHAANPMGYEDLVFLPDNTWSEIADVINICTQLAMQHGKMDVLQKQLEFKVERQLERIEVEKNGKSGISD